jgi:uncharacterized protein (TIGR01319 family)
VEREGSMSSVLDADTVLAIDVGSVSTRASLFDVVDGRYRLIATGRAPSTADAPLFDISEGVRMALDQVHEVTGRQLLDESELLIMPVTSQGAGADVFVATASAGPKVRTVLVGLMPGVSTTSAQRMADSTYLELVEVINLLDRRRDEEKISRIAAARADLILVVGGTDGGARDSVLQMIELVAVGVELIPARQRPRIVYAGNRRLASAVAERFGNRLDIAQAPNVRPALRQEDLVHARLAIGEAIAEARGKRVNGFQELEQWSGGYLMLTADAYGRVIKYLSRIYDPEKAVIGVDVGASHTMVAASFEGDLRLRVDTELGLGRPLPLILKRSNLDNIMRWLPIDLPKGAVLDYIHNKVVHPGLVPSEDTGLHLELALTRELIRTALKKARAGWPRGKDLKSTWLLPPTEPIIASGSALARTPHPGYAALTLLDGLEPTGITTMVLDPHGLSPSLGAASGPVPMLAVQVLESGSYVSLGTVVAPVGRTRLGRKILTLHMEPEHGSEAIAGEIRMGQLAVIPLRQGEYARLTLRPERGINVGFGSPGKAGALRIAGGALGLIIDARGRPLKLDPDPARRRDTNEKWLWDIGAKE